MGNTVRLGHTGDWHVTENHRLEETIEVLRRIAEDGNKSNVDLWIISGDLTGHTVPHRSTPTERRVVADTIQAMAHRVPVVIIRGNHDLAEDIEIYGRLKADNEIIVVARQPIATIVSAARSLVSNQKQFFRNDVRLYCLPYPSKRWAQTAGLDGEGIEDSRENVAEALRGILASWRLDRPAHKEDPAIMVAHLNVAGSTIGGGEVMIGREIELAPGDLDELGMDYIALGHIHKAQKISDIGYYAGSPTRQNFGEQSYRCCYLVADIAVGEPPKVDFRTTPARRLLTVEATWSVDEAGIWGWHLPVEDWPGDVRDAEVRLLVHVGEEAVSTCPMTELFDRITGAGAVSLQVERRVIPTIRNRGESVAKALDLPAKLGAYWTALGDAAPAQAQRERCLEKLTELEGE